MISTDLCSVQTRGNYKLPNCYALFTPRTEPTGHRCSDKCLNNTSMVFIMGRGKHQRNEHRCRVRVLFGVS